MDGDLSVAILDAVDAYFLAVRAAHDTVQTSNYVREALHLTGDRATPIDFRPPREVGAEAFVAQLALAGWSLVKESSDV